jgi:hypothetical protein
MPSGSGEHHLVSVQAEFHHFRVQRRCGAENSLDDREHRFAPPAMSSRLVSVCTAENR